MSRHLTITPIGRGLAKKMPGPHWRANPAKGISP